MRKSVNFHSPHCTKRELDILFGPFEDDEVTHVLEPNDATIAHLLHKVGLTKSISQGRQNGFGIPIPSGFTQLTYGKLKHSVSIFKKD